MNQYSTFSVFRLLPLLVVIMLWNISCNTSRKTLVVEEGWELIGETRPNFIREKDEIEITSSTEYTALRILVEDRDVKLSNLRIEFQNGDVLTPKLEEILPADQYTKDIDLGREGRAISRIEFKYRTKGSIFKSRAKVMVFGKQRRRWN